MKLHSNTEFPVFPKQNKTCNFSLKQLEYICMQEQL